MMSTNDAGWFNAEQRNGLNRRQNVERIPRSDRHGHCFLWPYFGTFVSNDLVSVERRFWEASTVSTLDDIRLWIDSTLDAPEEQKTVLVRLLVELVDRQRSLWEESKLQAMQAMQTAFADRLAQARDEVNQRDQTVANITRYFEEVV